MTSLVPLLIEHANKRCGAPAPIVSAPPQLVVWLAQNGLILRDDTLSDGNCGIHAFLLSLVDFADRNPTIKATNKYKQLSRLLKKGSTATQHITNHMRGVAAQWMRDNADVFVWDGMTFRQVALAMSHKADEPYDDHVRRMETNKEWVDASVIHALACAFGVDVAIWQAQVDPMLVGYGMLSKGPSRGLLVIAVNNDHHFWGVVAAKADAILAVGKSDRLEPWMRLPRAAADSNGSSDTNANADDGDDNLINPLVFDLAPPVISADDVDAELHLCGCLATWVPWDMPTAEINNSLAAMRSPTTAHRCLLREQVVADMVWESENADSMPVRLRCNAASRYRIQRGRVYRAPGTLEADALKTHADLEQVNSQLMRPCWKNGRPHTCLDVFKARPDIIRVWRVLWHCLPATIRREKLIDMMAPSFRQHMADRGEWNFDAYRFLGQPVCRVAFMRLTGIGGSSLTAAKNAVLMHKVSSCAHNELSRWMLIVSNSKPPMYLDCRQWLEWYADTHADKSPLTLTSYLPGGRKSFYHLIYEQDRRSAGLIPASLQTFLQAWRCETPWILIPRRIGKFLKCAVCEWLKLQIDRCPRSNPELMSALKTRLSTHFHFQSIQRLVQSRIQELCHQSNGTKWFVKTDKMDEKATVVATQWSQLSTPFFQSGERLIVAINGSFYHGLKHSQVHMRTMFEDTEHGSEMQMSTFLMNFHEAALLENRLPEELYLGADNTPKETKNKYGCWWCMWLMCVMLIHNLPLHSVCLVFLLVGHTHDDIDRFFRDCASP